MYLCKYELRSLWSIHNFYSKSKSKCTFVLIDCISAVRFSVLKPIDGTILFDNK